MRFILWIILKDLPSEYRCPDTLEFTGDKIGIFLSLDSSTSENSGSTRLCILLDTTRSLPRSIKFLFNSRNGFKKSSKQEVLTLIRGDGDIEEFQIRASQRVVGCEDRSKHQSFQQWEENYVNKSNEASNKQEEKQDVMFCESQIGNNVKESYGAIEKVEHDSPDWSKM